MQNETRGKNGAGPDQLGGLHFCCERNTGPLRDFKQKSDVRYLHHQGDFMMLDP